MSSRRSRLPLQGRRNLDAKSHATSNVWSGAGFASGAHPRLASAAREGRRRQAVRAAEALGSAAAARGSGRAGRAPRLDKASSGGWGAGAAVGGERAVRQAATLDGQPSGSTLAEQNGTPRTTGHGLGQRRARAGPRPQKRGKQGTLHG